MGGGGVDFVITKKEERLEKKKRERKDFFVQVDKRGGNFVSSVWVSNLPTYTRYLWVFLEFLFLFFFVFVFLFFRLQEVSGFDRK